MILIAGAGIGGLAAALSLHHAGLACRVFEQSAAVRELGVGVNVLPHAIAILADLGLLPALDAAGIRTRELTLANRFGQAVWTELRGTEAGHAAPQFSIHRGRLLGVLHAAAVARGIPVRTGERLAGFSQNADGVTAVFETGETVTGEALIGADGIHSVVRHAFFKEGPPAWTGIMLWRGAVEWPVFADGRSMLVAGGMRAKFVLYPIMQSRPGTRLTNWAVAARVSDGSTPPPRREDWSRPGRLEDLLPFVQDNFQLDRLGMVDPMALIRASAAFWEYPMCDRDPLPAWTHGRVTLLGDAAHPMYPVGSNGASQAVLDGAALARHVLALGAARGLAAYDAERRPATAEVVRLNRAGGPERVIDVVEERAPYGFSDIEAVASHAERQAIVRGYAVTAGFAPV
ncbi:MAG: FAD-dependent monooxygenase [Janthinobacterium lividum]